MVAEQEEIKRQIVAQEKERLLREHQNILH
jgi:hypothetical protein